MRACADDSASAVRCGRVDDVRMATPARAGERGRTERMIALEGLVGTWRGEGEGSYPGVAPFGYREETTIEAAAEWRMLRVVQQTWHRESGKGLHLEVGLIMHREDGTLLYNCAQDSGRVEVMIGTLTDQTIAWQTTAHANDPRGRSRTGRASCCLPRMRSATSSTSSTCCIATRSRTTGSPTRSNRP